MESANKGWFLRFQGDIKGMKQIVPLALVGLLCVRCAFFEEEEQQTFTLPYASSWSVVTTTGSGQTFTVTGDSFSTRVVKNEATAVLAFDLTGGEADNPCGTIYPYAHSLNYVDGFAASVLYSLLASTTDDADAAKSYLSAFNWVRFMEACREWGDDVWSLDKEYIMQKIAQGSFRVTYIKLLE